MFSIFRKGQQQQVDPSPFRQRHNSSTKAPPPSLELDMSFKLDTPAVHDQITRTTLVVKFAEQRWKSILGPLTNWIDLIAHVQSTTLRSPSEISIYKKILQRRIEVNHYRTDGRASQRCPRCQDDETIQHLLVGCTSSVQFLIYLRSFLTDALGVLVEPIGLRDLVYFFPEMRSTLSSSQLKSLTIAHSCALIALVEARKYPLFNCEFIVKVFAERYHSRQYFTFAERDSMVPPDTGTPSLSRDSLPRTPSDVHSVISEGLPVSEYFAGMDSFDIMQEILMSEDHGELADHQSTLTRLIGLY